MKKLVLVMLTACVLVACSQPKDIYFNGAEGSHSGIKYDKSSESFGLNP
ncbi:hypothetical protein [Lonepinella sp. BR2271]